MTRLHRDRLTWLSYAQLGIWGYFLYAFAPVVPLLQDEQGTSKFVASLHGSALAVGSMLGGGVVYPYLLKRFGRGATVWIGLGGVAAGVGVLCLVEPLPLTLAAVLFASVFGIVVVSYIAPTLTALHGPKAPAAISEANAGAAGLGVIAPMVVGASVGIGWGWRPAIAVTVALIAGLGLYALLTKVPAAPAQDVSHHDRPGRLPVAYWFAWMVVALCGAVEVCLTQWGSVVLRDHAGMSEGGAAGSIAAIVGGMFVGRLAGGRLGLRYSPPALLLGSIGLALAGFAVFWLSTTGALAVAGLVIAGLGMSVHYPMGIALAIEASAGHPDRATGLSAYAMGLSFAVTTFVLAPIADRVGIHPAFLLVPVFLALAALCVWQVARRLPARLVHTPAAEIS
ncbi:MFS transporter [Longispora albida]|uniref:MFS transporter n=1 Tax=Longispora albida TaxID=203523 RepID=UPI0003800486|nr:MFS transporter [Longispora albida]